MSNRLWGDGSVKVQLLLECDCGNHDLFTSKDIGWMFTMMDLLDRGWRFNDVGEKTVCPTCGPKKFPELYKHAYQSYTPSGVRRLRSQEGKLPEKEVRKPRRIRRG